MAKIKKKVYAVTDCGFDEYPSSGLRLSFKDNEIADINLIEHLGLKPELGDEVEITAKIISRVKTERVKL